MRIFFILAYLLLSMQASAKEDMWHFQKYSGAFVAEVSSKNMTSELTFSCAKGVDKCTVFMSIPSVKCQGRINSLATTEKYNMAIPLYCHAKSGLRIFDLNAKEIITFMAIANVGSELTMTIALGKMQQAEINFTLNGAGAAIAKVIASNAKAMKK